MRRNRPIEFRTVLILYILLGIVIALTIHFIVLSSARYNWLQVTQTLAPSAASYALHVPHNIWMVS